MTPNTFRGLALGFPGAVESAHMNHSDFRVAGKVFATLGYPDDAWAMIKLTPEKQQSFVRDAAPAFRPCKGVWGQRGATNVHLASATEAQVRSALEASLQAVTLKTEKSSRRRPREPQVKIDRRARR